VQDEHHEEKQRRAGGRVPWTIVIMAIKRVRRTDRTWGETTVVVRLLRTMVVVVAFNWCQSNVDEAVYRRLFP
jgi:hypothetical protein